ncbi:phage virion morphogenesis protein [Croceicoccus sp. YJ47]|uniref:phage virion morphogenesis protein n=1 Tax=Croceicoccus sp. YJ47 TaxID=2798724 RepID=UPI001921D9F1|nr:phage virion morphogenesis protein [Croceicoccus sp. YJ47]QQN73175.1 phage virion morphogenesis protein [Croceicoccus sp. YJ47]
MTDAGHGLDDLGRFFDDMLADISPARRRLVARKIGQQLRRSNLARMAANEEPDGGAMEPRKDRGDKRLRRRKMFRRLRYARHLTIKPSDEGVELRFRAGSNRIASDHHFGRESYVGKTKAGDTIRARYPRRRLLGFARDDIDGMTDELLEWLDR